MKQFFMLLTVLLFMASFAFAGDGKYVFKDAIVVGWPTATDEGASKVNCNGFKNPYAVTLDGVGNIWFGAYFERFYLDTDGTTKIYPDRINIVKPDTTIVKSTFPTFILKTDGTVEVIQYLEFEDGRIDTTYYGHRGMATLPDGNVIVTYRNAVYKIDYRTKKVLLKFDVPNWSNVGSAVGAEADANGFVYVTALSGGVPLWVLDPEDFSIYNQVTDNVAQMQRNIAVSADGKDVYIGAISGSNGAVHYYSADGPDGTYALVDTIFNQYVKITGTDTVKNPIQSHFCQMSPTGILYMGTVEEAAKKILWGLDPASEYAVVDSTSFIFWGNTDKTDTTLGNYPKPQYIRAPRDAAWTSDGKTMYIADFYSYVIKVFEWQEGSAVPNADNNTPVIFDLEQNFPNPFNPVTTIYFSLPSKGNVDMRIFDAMGREIKTLVNEELNAGNHQVDFSASGLASGTYFYKLIFNGTTQTRRMVLLK